MRPITRQLLIGASWHLGAGRGPARAPRLPASAAPEYGLHARFVHLDRQRRSPVPNEQDRPPQGDRPAAPGVLTSNAGWDTRAHKSLLTDVIARFREAGIRTSLFTGTDTGLIAEAASCGADRIELYTEPYVAGFAKNPETALAPFREAAIAAHSYGLGINAGHDLNLENLSFFARNVPHLLEVSIGHALISDALYYGLANTIQMYQRQLF